MAESALVSCIIPTYNRKQSLVRAIKSIKDQTYKNTEIIVVDDDSTIDTESIIKDNFSDVKLISHSENKGAGGARNTGIKHSQGEFVAFLDSDDEWLPRKLDEQVSVLLNDPSIGVVGCRSYSKWESMNIICRSSTIDTSNHVDIFTSTEAKKYMLSTSSLVTTSQMVVRRDLLNLVDGFDENLPSMQEHDLNVRLSSHCNFARVNEPLIIKDAAVSNRISHDFEAKFQGLKKFRNKHSKEIDELLSDYEKQQFVDERLPYIYQLKVVSALADKRYITAVRAIRKWRKARLGLDLKHYFLIMLVAVFGSRGNRWANKLRYVYNCIQS